MKKIVIVSHSGGLDSSVLISKAISLGYDVQPINFNYGQKNLVEITSQKRVVERFKEMYGDRIKDTINIDSGTVEDFKKKFRPDLISMIFYGTVEYFHIILKLNGMKSLLEFIPEEKNNLILVFKPEIIPYII